MSCPTCGARVPEGAVRCGACGQALGESNRCAACGGLSAVREIAEGRFVCSACGAPRVLRPGTALEATLGELLERRARRSRLLAGLLRGVSAALVLAGLALSGVMAVFSSDFAFMPVLLAALPGAAAFALGRRETKKALQLADQALERRLLTEVAGHAAGISPAAAASALSRSEEEIDARLTHLAKRGQLSLEVTDEGQLRYRVAALEEDQVLTDQIVTGLHAERERNDLE